MCEHILVDVNDAVAEFLVHDDKRERRYQWKIKKQMQDAGICRTVYLDEIKYDSNTNEQYFVANIIEDIINPENRNPLSIIIEREFTDTLYHLYSQAMTQKQYEILKFHEQGYTTSDIAKVLGIDESSARERLHNALKKAVEMHVMHSNYDILTGLQEFIFKDLYGKISATKYNNLFSSVFRLVIALINPSQRELIKFIIGNEHENKIIKYLDSLKPTPEKPT